MSQNELTNYLVQSAAQYEMEPAEFIQVLDQNGQIPAMIAEVARAKALALILSKAKVVDTDGKDVDVSEFTAAVIGEDDEDEDAAFDTSEVTSLLNQANPETHDHDHDHEGHSH